MNTKTALVADDEPLLRDRLIAQLARLWPELKVVAQARNGREAVELFDEHNPDIVFLDVHMPGMNGVEAARCIGRRAQVVFVTAFEQYAVEAFRQGALDYVVKPLDEERLADTVARLKERLAETAAQTPAQMLADTPADIDTILQTLAQQLKVHAAPQARLNFIKASVGNSVRMIPVDEVVYFRSDTKYTLVVWAAGEALIRKTIKELADELDSEKFAQVHRSIIVNLGQVSHVQSGANETANLSLKGRAEQLPISRSYLHLFRQM
jgi:DNA-binding LytR/AlgR family response regulator